MRKKIFLLFLVFLIVNCNSRLPANLSTFEMTPVPENIKSFSWIKLLDDKSDDGDRKQSADGKEFYYFFDQKTDLLWFRFDLFNQINTENPAVSVAIDVDNDQNNGINWYGTNSKFKFEKMISVGPTKKQEDKFIGYNGITNQEGVREQNWINEKSGNIKFFFDKESNAYFIGVSRRDIDVNLKKFNVIGSVGQNALWNDDIGDSGFATIELNIS